MATCDPSYIDTLITGLVSLGAAFAGAFFAFQFQNRSARKVIEDRHIDSVQVSLVHLIRMINIVGSYRKQIIDPVRDEVLRFMSLPPTPEMNERFDIPLSELSFFMSSPHANLITDLSLLKIRFNNLVEAINRRSLQHQTEIQPALLQAGAREGEAAISKPDLETLIGHQTYSTMKKLTDDIVVFSDEIFEELIQAAADIRSAALNLYPAADIPEFRLDDSIAKAAG